MPPVGACGKDEPTGPAQSLPAGTGSGSAVVTYQPRVHVLEREAGLEALAGTSTDGWTLLFSAGVPEVESLKAGDVLLIKGLIARNVLAVEKQPDGEIAVLTRSATLGEALEQGHLEVQAGVRFGSQGATLVPRRSLWDLVEGTAHAQSPDGERLRNAESKGAADARKQVVTSVAKAFYEGWDATMSAVPEAGRVKLDIVLTKSVGGFKALITGKGYVADFDLTSQIDVERGLVERLQIAASHLNGAMDFTWEVGKDTPGIENGNARIKLPVSVSIPLYQYLAGFPLFLDITAAILVQPVISGGSEYTKGAFHITYSGSQGFDLAKGAMDSSASKVTGDSGLDHLHNISAVAPLGMVISFAAPRFELNVGVAKIIKADEFKKAAVWVDRIANRLIEHTLGADAFARWKASPMGGFDMEKSVDAMLKSDAAAYLELDTTTAMSDSGMSVVRPCSKTEIHLSATVGASAQAFGLSAGSTKSVLFKKDFTRIDPPGATLCR
jgi:hypothetical protein